MNLDSERRIVKPRKRNSPSKAGGQRLTRDREGSDVTSLERGLGLELDQIIKLFQQANPNDKAVYWQDLIIFWEKVRRYKGRPQNQRAMKTRAAVNGEFLLSLLLSNHEQEAAIGDFLERYAQKLRRLGKRRADLWAYSDVARTVWPVLRRKLAKMIGIVGAAEWIRRHLS